MTVIAENRMERFEPPPPAITDTLYRFGPQRPLRGEAGRALLARAPAPVGDDGAHPVETLARSGSLDEARSFIVENPEQVGDVLSRRSPSIDRACCRI